MEILAPAGNFASLKAAVYNGANAVYLGLGKFNARAKAENFNEENLEEAVHFAHLFGVKVYCAFNTLIKDNEMAEVLDSIMFADKCNVDAIIVQDFGLIDAISHTMPHIVMHASTQMGIHNLEGAIELESLGVKRVILSRETFLEDIKKIHDGTNLEIEFFVHGALCVAFSGNCYFSSLVSGYSGNRGKCMQLCRKQYTLSDGSKKKTGYYLSTKDLCLIDELNVLKSAGVVSIKIEGRLRSAEYVGECVRVYKKALSSGVANDDIDTLKTVFNRGDFCQAHLYNCKGSIIFPMAQNNIGLRVGKIKAIKNNIAILESKVKLSVGDGVKYLRNGNEVGHGLITNDNNTTTFIGNLKIDDEIRLTSSRAIVDAVLKSEYKLKISATIYLNSNELPKLILNYENINVVLYGKDIVETAKKQPLTVEGVKNNLSKLGATYFELSEINVEMSDNLFYPVGKINDLRRDGILQLEKKICDSFVNQSQKSHTTSRIVKNKWLQLKPKSNLFVQIDDYNVVNLKLLETADYVVYNPSSFNLSDIREFKKTFGSRAILNLPIIARGKDVALLKDIVDNSGIEIFIVNNLYGINLCKNKLIIAGWGLNQLNNCLDITKIVSLECETYEYSNNNILYTYGYEPFMTLCHCPKYDLGMNCQTCNNGDKLMLSDDRNDFILRRIKLNNCYWQLINSIPLNLLEESNKMNKCNRFIDFTNVIENDEVKNILQDINYSSVSSLHTHANFGKKLY